MLKPEQVRSHRFISAGRSAYEADDVDLFFSEVSASYEQMFKENGELVKKISLLAGHVSQYKNDEDNIRRALLTAERMADKIQREAQQNAQDQLDSAEKKAQDILSSAKNRADILETAASVKASELNEESQRTATERVTSAERTASAMIHDAEERAEKIISDSKRTAQEELDRINHEIKINSEALEILRTEVTDFKRSLLDLYRSHIELITSLPEKETASEISEQAVAEQDDTYVAPTAEESVAVTEQPEQTEAETALPAQEEDLQHTEDDNLAPDEAVEQDIAKATETAVEPEKEVVAADEIYDPMSAADTSAEDAAQHNDEDIVKASTAIEDLLDEDESDESDAYDKFLRGFVINLDEIESSIEAENDSGDAGSASSGDSAEYFAQDTLSDTPADDEDNTPTTYSRFRGFFRK